MAIKTTPLAQPRVKDTMELPGMKPALTAAPSCPMCGRAWRLTWEPDYAVQNLERRARRVARAEQVAIFIVGLAAALLFVGALLVFTGGR